MSRRTLLLANSVFRFAWGAAALAAPRAMAAARMVPDTEGSPEARLFVRGFGGHQVAVGAAGIASVRWPRLEPAAIVLAVVIDAMDMLSAAVEAQARGSVDEDTGGGFALSAAGLATAAAALGSRD